jgi:hypothetical protein
MTSRWSNMFVQFEMPPNLALEPTARSHLAKRSSVDKSTLIR